MYAIEWGLVIVHSYVAFHVWTLLRMMYNGRLTSVIEPILDISVSSRPGFQVKVSEIKNSLDKERLSYGRVTNYMVLIRMAMLGSSYDMKEMEKAKDSNKWRKDEFKKISNNLFLMDIYEL